MMSDSRAAESQIHGDSSTGPLSDVSVLAAEHLIAAPFATQLLADLGAEVIRVERPGSGAMERSISPYIDIDDGTRESLIMYRVDRNKKSITLDVTSEEGARLFGLLAGQVDALIENFRPGVLERRGLDYTSLSTLNPALVYVSISGYGQRDILPSPYSEYAAFGNIAESLAGITHSLMESSDHGFSGFHGMALGDIVSGLFAVSGLLASLHEARATGRGRHVDVAMMDSLFTLNERAIATASRPGRAGSALDPPSGILGNFRAKDGWFTLTVLGEEHWPALCEAIENIELLNDPLLSDADKRSEHLESRLREPIELWAGNYSKDEAAKRLRESGLAAAPVLTPAELLDDDHIQARQMLAPFGLQPDGQAAVRVPGNPIKMTGHNPVFRPPPSLGQDTDEILQRMCGVSLDEIEQLRANGIV